MALNLSKLVIYSTFLTSLSHLTLASTKQAVVENYSNIGYAVFQDALLAAKSLQQSINKLVHNPDQATLSAAQHAWKAARVPYQQSEVFRFGNAIVDNWEGQLNAWPLDEGLIDYVEQGYTGEMGNAAATANIIANPELSLGDSIVDTRQITPQLLASLNELGGSEANVATGYHAIEFLLWGQDLNGTGPGAGARPHTDYMQGKQCTHGHCARRAAYLQAATELLVSDLQSMVEQWQPGHNNNYRAQLLALPATEGLTRMLYGMGSLSLGELAGERLKVALEANSPEDEHDCFSDNTHYSHYYNALGIQNIYRGQYRRINGTVIKGASLSDLVARTNKTLDAQTQAALSHTESQMQVLVAAAESDINPMKFDQMISEGNEQGEKIVRNAIEALVKQTRQLEKVARALGINNLNPDTADHAF